MATIFEDSRAIGPGSLLRVFSGLELHSGSLIPEDYGVAWYEPHRNTVVCAPMPWHAILGWAYRTYWHWRMKVTDAHDMRLALYEAGARHEREAADRQGEVMAESHRQELKAARAEGRREGERAILEVVRTVQNEMGCGKTN